MLISYKHKYLYIASPKTGSRSTKSFLQEHDPTAIKNRYLENGERIHIKGHSTALELKEALGETFDELKKVAIIRHPYSKMVSSYFFYKNGQAITPGNHNPYPTLMRIWFAKLLPFKLWSLLYPYKSNRGHLVDQNGNLLVDYIGTIENLAEDIVNIFNELGLDLSKEDFPHNNKSKHKSYETYFNSGFHKWLVDKKVKKDMDFYNEVISKQLVKNEKVS